MNNRIALLSISLALTAACANKDATPPAQPDDAATADQPAEAASSTIVEIAVADGNFTTLVSALQAAGLDKALSGDGPFTVFAPTDAAFAKLPEGALDALLADPDGLEAVLTYHVVQGKVMAADVAGLTEATALSGETLPIDSSSGVKVGAATVVKADIEASNGVIHVIDTVLMPAG